MPLLHSAWKSFTVGGLNRSYLLITIHIITMKGGIIPMQRKKGQMSLADAPQIVLIVGLVFLLMATMAFIGQKYGVAVSDKDTTTVINETFTPSPTGTRLSNASACNFGNFAVATVLNATNSIINPTNYTVGSTGTIANSSSSGIFGWTNWKATYSYTGGGVACDVTTDLNTELANNTSIAGIVLTISLIGIVLTVLIGIFLVTRGTGRA